jgi:hypothetical protein
MNTRPDEIRGDTVQKVLRLSVKQVHPYPLGARKWGNHAFLA